MRFRCLPDRGSRAASGNGRSARSTSSSASKDANPSTNFTALRAAPRHPRQLRHRRDVPEQGSERLALQPRLRRGCELPLLRRSHRQRGDRQERDARREPAWRRSGPLFEEQLSAIATTSGKRAACIRRSARGSTTRWASCRASASTTPSSISARTSGRSAFAGWMRETFPHFQFENFTQAQRRRPRVALHGLALADYVPEQRVHRGRRQPEHRSHRRPLHDQQPPRHLRRPGPLRVQGILRARQHQRGGAVLDEPALRQRRVLRRLPPQLHHRRHVPPEPAPQRVAERSDQRHRPGVRDRSSPTWSPGASTTTSTPRSS